MIYFVSAVILLGICIFIHELGHLLGGRMVGIKAKVFSIGYGKGFIKKKIGDTTYQVTLIPFGGYCQFYGEEPGEAREGKGYEFLSASPWRRIVVVVMGPIFNLLLGIIIFFMLNFVGYEKESNKISIPEYLTKGKSMSTAYKAGLRSGDRVIKINDKKIMGFSDLQTSIIFYDGSGKPMKITVLRNKEKKVFKVIPKRNFKGYYVIGVLPTTNEVFVNNLVSGGVAQKAGFKVGDVILKLDDKIVATPTGLQNYVKERTNKTIKVDIKRDNKILTKTVVPEKAVILIMSKPKDPGKSATIDAGMLRKSAADRNLIVNNKLYRSVELFTEEVKKYKNKNIEISVNGRQYNGQAHVFERGMIGISMGRRFEMTHIRHSLVDSLVLSVKEPWEFIVINIKGMGMLFSGKMDVRENLSGPVKIGQLAGRVAQEKGTSAFIMLIAKISIILMVMNLLPIPVVDGGHLMFFLIEGIRGKPLSENVMARIQSVAVIFLITLFVFILINDIYSLDAIKNLFSW